MHKRRYLLLEYFCTGNLDKQTSIDFFSAVKEQSFLDPEHSPNLKHSFEPENRILKKQKEMNPLLPIELLNFSVTILKQLSQKNLETSNQAKK